MVLFYECRPQCARKALDNADILREESRVENRRSGFSLPVATDEAFASSPQSGLAWLCFLFAGWGGGADRASNDADVSTAPPKIP
jgi:hypothetical protein